MSSESEFAYSLKYNTHFIVRNTTGTHELSPYKKTISIFNAPINTGQCRDLLELRGVTEEDIRASLLKGVLRHKLLCGDIELVSSNIDLLQFSDKQRDFLFQFGFNTGVQIGYNELDGYVQTLIDQGGGGNLNYTWKENIPLIGMKDGINRVFYTPDKFINGNYYENDFNITIEHNGRNLYENIDYNIAESGGVGTGYDTINILSFTPNINSLLYATYVIVA